jgi:DNA-binding PadR family transcriptional regulator
MKPDVALTKHMLAILRRIGDAGMEQHSLLTEMEIASGRMLTTAQAEDTLIDCVDHGWINCRVDDFQRQIYWLTDRGKTRLAGL